jgi:hypothetical protein
MSTDLEENSNFHVIENTFVDVDVDVEELNDILRTSGYTKVDKDNDSDEINVEDCDGDDENEKKKKIILSNLHNMNV